MATRLEQLFLCKKTFYFICIGVIIMYKIKTAGLHSRPLQQELILFGGLYTK